MTVYVAGELYKPNVRGGDNRKPGDVIPEASDWPPHTIKVLLRRRELEEQAIGEWVYVAGPRYKGKEKPGDVLDVSNLPTYLIPALLEYKEIEKVDSATLKAQEPAPVVVEKPVREKKVKRMDVGGKNRAQALLEKLKG